MTRPRTRHLVLDNEAVAALLTRQPGDPKRALVIRHIVAANGRRVVPVAVRVEANWARSDPRTAEANRLVPEDDALDRTTADRCVELRRAVPSASVVDAAVAVTAERLGVNGLVGIVTSDPHDLAALAAHLDAAIDVHRI